MIIYRRHLLTYIPNFSSQKHNKEDNLWQVTFHNGNGTADLSLQDFTDNGLDSLSTDFWKGAIETPHRIHGSGGTVFWRNCTQVILAQYIKDKEAYEVIKQVRNTGQGMLRSGLTLIFMGKGGEAKEG